MDSDPETKDVDLAYHCNGSGGAGGEDWAEIFWQFLSWG